MKEELSYFTFRIYQAMHTFRSHWLVITSTCIEVNHTRLRDSHIYYHPMGYNTTFHLLSKVRELCLPLGDIDRRPGH